MQYVGIDVSERIADSAACVGMYGLCARIFVFFVCYSLITVTVALNSILVVAWHCSLQLATVSSSDTTYIFHKESIVFVFNCPMSDRLSTVSFSTENVSKQLDNPVVVLY